MTVKRQKYDITIEISEGELRQLIMVHARRIDQTLWTACTQDALQQSAERLSALLEILKKRE